MVESIAILSQIFFFFREQWSRTNMKISCSSLHSLIFFQVQTILFWRTKTKTENCVIDLVIFVQFKYSTINIIISISKSVINSYSWGRLNSKCDIWRINRFHSIYFVVLFCFLDLSISRRYTSRQLGLVLKHKLQNY